MPRRRHFAWPAYGALATACALAVVAPAAIEAARWWPLLLGLVLLGLPHGAVDHKVPERLGAGRAGRAFLGGYVALAGAVLVLWWAAPAPALALFLVVAALHWGLGDVWFARHVNARAPFARRWRFGAFVAARGLLPVALPLLAHPAAVAEGTGAVLGAVGGDPAGWAPAGALRAAGLVLVGVAVALALLAARLDHRGRRDRRPLRYETGELALLAATFALVPPVFAVGVYFVAWHSARHVARLMASAPRQARLLAADRVARAVAAWHREAAPLTAVSLAGLAVLAGLVWQVPATASALTGAALALIAALTIPHALAVGWMDRVQLATVLAPRSAASRDAHRGRLSEVDGPGLEPDPSSR